MISYLHSIQGCFFTQPLIALTRIIHVASLSARLADFRRWTKDVSAHDPRRLERRPLGADRGAGGLRFRGLIGASAPLINRWEGAGAQARALRWPCRDRRLAGAA